MSRFKLILICLFFCAYANANAALPASNATTISVKKDCAVGDNSCFGDLTSALNWVWNTRHPTADSPVTMNVGAGRFLLPTYFCQQQGYLSVQGSGRKQTVIASSIAETGSAIGLNIEQCQDLSFSNLTIEGDIFGIYWNGSGSSSYSNVNLIAKSNGWYDDSTSTLGCDPSNNEHYWFGSKVIATGLYGTSIAFRSQCGTTWFFGGEISAKNPNNLSLTTQSAISVQKNAQIQVFGALVRAVAGNVAYPDPGVGTGLTTISASDNAKVHMHGGIISAVAKQGNVSVATIAKTPSAFVHIIDTAFNPTASGTGTASRIIGDNALSPFQWPQSTTPPNIQTENGADTFVEIDCDSTGNCDNPVGQTHPNLMAYDASCTAGGPWFNMTTNKCRGQ